MGESAAEDRQRAAEMFESAIPHNRELGIRITGMGETTAKMSMPFAPHLVGDPETGVLAGGVVTTLMDSVCGLAVMAAMPAPGPIATLDLRIDYLRPATPGEELLAEADCFRLTRSIAFARGTAYHASGGGPIAAVQGTFIMKGESAAAEASGWSKMSSGVVGEGT